MNPIDEVRETLLDKGYDEVSAIWIMQMRGITATVMEILDPSFLPFYADQEYVENFYKNLAKKRQERREQLAREFLIELNYWKPCWNKNY
jgi:hypothetical protein